MGGIPDYWLGLKIRQTRLRTDQKQQKKAQSRKQKKKQKLEAKKAKSWQHPKDFPSGPPPQYYPGPVVVNCTVLKSCGVFTTVWPPAEFLLSLGPGQSKPVAEKKSRTASPKKKSDS